MKDVETACYNLNLLLSCIPLSLGLRGRLEVMNAYVCMYNIIVESEHDCTSIPAIIIQ
jgi:hypothetical protein